MRKVAMAAAAAALVIGAPALAGGERGSGPAALSSYAPMGHVLRVLWRSSLQAPPPGFSSPGRHLGWSIGKHWGWFKNPKNPNWPHHPVSP